jgi:diguanylate cyclase
VNKSGQPIGKMTASFGVASLSEADSPDLLVQRADGKLYDAKRSGRNCVAVHGRV